MQGKNGFLKTSIQMEKSVVERVISQITNAIISGELKPGDRVPTEAELSETFQVGRNSIREAIKILVSFGVIYIKRPDGTFVSESYNQKMLDPMLYGIILQKDAAEDIIELRKVIDIGILQVAMSKLSDEQIDQIEEELQQLIGVIHKEHIKVEEVLEADIRFHMAIVKAIDNELLESMYNYVDRITIPSRTRATNLILDSSEISNFIKLHEEIILLIRNKDALKIGDIVEQHYYFWHKIK